MGRGRQHCPGALDSSSGPPQSPHMLGEQGCPTGAAKGKRCIWKMKKSCLSSLQRMGDCCQQTQTLKKKGLRHLTRGSADPGHPWSSGCCCTPLLLAALSFLCCSHKDPTQPGCFLHSPLVSFEAKKSVNTSTTQPCSHLTADQYTKPAGEGSLLLPTAQVDRQPKPAARRGRLVAVSRVTAPLRAGKQMQVDNAHSTGNWTLPPAQLGSPQGQKLDVSKTSRLLASPACSASCWGTKTKQHTAVKTICEQSKLLLYQSRTKIGSGPDEHAQNPSPRAREICFKSDMSAAHPGLLTSY